MGSIGVLSSTYSGITGAAWLNGSQLASQAYFWYQSKSIKETLLLDQRDFILSLKNDATSAGISNQATEQYVANVAKKIQKLDKEKHEILVGSKNIDKSKWAQDMDGKYGQIVGAKEWGKIADDYGSSSEYFTYATVYIQLSLVLGALSIMIAASIPRHMALYIMIVLGLYGSYLCTKGYMIYTAILV